MYYLVAIAIVIAIVLVWYYRHDIFKTKDGSTSKDGFEADDSGRWTFNVPSPVVGELIKPATELPSLPLKNLGFNKPHPVLLPIDEPPKELEDNGMSSIYAGLHRYERPKREQNPCGDSLNNEQAPDDIMRINRQTLYEGVGTCSLAEQKPYEPTKIMNQSSNATIGGSAPTTFENFTTASAKEYEQDRKEFKRFPMRDLWTSDSHF